MLVPASAYRQADSALDGELLVLSDATASRGESKDALKDEAARTTKGIYGSPQKFPGAFVTITDWHEILRLG